MTFEIKQYAPDHGGQRTLKGQGHENFCGDIRIETSIFILSGVKTTLPNLLKFPIC